MNVFSYNQDKAPSVPLKRGYNVTGSVKISYPHYRIMKEDFSGKILN